MNAPNWKSLSQALAALLFSFLTALLITPLFYPAADALGQTWNRPLLVAWIALVVLTGTAMGRVWSKKSITVSVRVTCLAAMAAAHLFLLWIGALSLWVHVPVILILVVLSLRFWLYYTVAEFPTDFALMALAMLFFLILQGRTAIAVGLWELIAFFGAGFALVLLFHVREMERQGFRAPYRMILVVMGLYLLLVLIVGAVGGIPLGVEATQVFLSILRAVYNAAAYVFLLLLYPIVRLLGPFMEWISDQFADEPRMEEEERAPQDMELDEFMEAAPDNGEAWTLPDGALWALGTAALIILLIWAFRRLQIPKLDEEEGVEEERSSVFSSDSLRRDVSALLKGWAKPLQDWAAKRSAAGGDPVLRIRAAYGEFLRAIGRIEPRRKDFTPSAFREYLHDKYVIPPALQRLTELYNRARYGERAGEEEAAEAEQAVAELRAEIRRVKRE